MKESYLLLVSMLLVGCAVRDVSPEELLTFVREKENGLYQVSESGGTKVEVIYKPTDLLVLQEIDGGSFQSSLIDSARRKYCDHYYFTVSLSHNDREALHTVGAGGDYSDLVNILSFRMNDYVSMTTSGRDTIPVADFILNRTYGMAASTDLLFVFSRKRAEGKKWIQFNLNEFGLGVGNQRFRFKTDDIENVPKIDFSLL